MSHDMWPLVRLHFLRGFRICAQFGLNRSNYRSNIHQTGFYWSEMEKFQQIYELWLVTPCSIAFFERIPNLCSIWSNSVILSVKCTSNRVSTVRYGKNPPRSMTNDMWPLIQLHFSRGFRISATFGQIRSNYRSNKRRTGFYWSGMAKVPK